MDLYRQTVLDHYKHPRNFGPAPRGVRGKIPLSHRETNSSCGDEVNIWIVVSKDKVVSDVGFTGQGCAIAMAGTSMLTEAIKGKKLAEVKKMTEAKAMNLFGTKINPARKKCATLGWVALSHVLVNH